MKKKYLVEYVELMKEYDYDKNTDFVPEKLTYGSDKKIWWKCSKGHSYPAAISNRVRGQGCPYCKGKKVLKGFNDLKTWCIENNRFDLINEFDNYKNDFTIEDITVGSGKNVYWICPNGHSYRTTLNHRIKMNTGCGICSHKLFLSGVNDLVTTHPHIAEEFDVNKNKIMPNEVMAGNNNKKYWFICSKGHSYKSTLLNRKKGRNCPECVKEMHVSFPEKAIFYYLNLYGICVIENYNDLSFGRMSLDIYLPNQRIGIEYDGKAWHKDIKRDLKKDILCERNNIKLIRIREKGCPNYESSSQKIYVSSGNLEELKNIIFLILSIALNKKVNKDELIINLEKDRLKIYKLLELNEKKDSILHRRPQIKLYWNKEKNGVLRPSQVTFSSMKKIYLKCELGHEWNPTVRQFYLSPRCPVCSGERILVGFNDLGTTHPELKKSWSNKNKNKITEYSYGSNAEVYWNCSICNGVYKKKISKKTLGKAGCPYCSNHQLLKGYNDLKTKYPDIAKEWSLTNDTQPEDYNPSSKTVVYWECSKGHIYPMKIYLRTLKKRGCPVCNNKVVLRGENDLLTCNPILADEFDVAKNEMLPSDVIYGGTKTYWWKCEKGHSYDLRISEKIKGAGCPVCSSHRLLKGYNDLETINPILAKEFHKQKNVSLLPSDFMANSGVKVWWLCPKCGNEWEARIIKRNKGQGCPKCGHRVKK